MSEIPFVARLGENLDRAIAASARPRRRRRALLFGGLAFAAVAATAGAYIATHDHDRQAVQAADGAECVPAASAFVASDGGDPRAACAKASGVPVEQLTLCVPDNSDSLAVVRAAPDACTARGWRDAQVSDTQRQRIADLRAALLPVEARCLSTSAFAGEVQAILDRQGWSGWHVRLAPTRGGGTCPSVTSMGGASGHFMGGALDFDTRTVTVTPDAEAPRAAEDAVYGADGLNHRADVLSGSRCFDAAGMEAAARTLVAGRGFAVTVVRETRASITAAMGGGPGMQWGLVFDGARGDRYLQGCTVIHTLDLSPDGRAVTVELVDHSVERP
ncbi:MAG: hypothetical protein U0Y82_04970 [Thermoleophilia bacterium]